MSTAGAVYLARELQELDACPPEALEPEFEAKPMRWPLVDCMSDRAVVAWASVLSEFGMLNAN